MTNAFKYLTSVLFAAIVCLSTVGDSDPVVHSIHNVAGAVLAVLGPS